MDLLNARSIRPTAFAAVKAVEKIAADGRDGQALFAAVKAVEKAMPGNMRCPGDCMFAAVKAVEKNPHIVELAVRSLFAAVKAVEKRQCANQRTSQ